MSKSYQQLSHRQALGIQYDDRRTDDVYGDKGILQNLLDIQRLLAHGKTAQPANTEENRWELNEKIYDQKKKILDDDGKDLDTQVQLGLIQENSFDYISKLYDIKQEIEKSDLNSIDRAEKLNEINEKIYSASKNYIEQLESDLSDEDIINSYGYKIKQVQDQIDAINNQAEAESKELAVEKDKAAWEEAQNQKTVQVYENGHGFVYTTNDKDVVSKKQALADAEREEQLEKLNQQKRGLQNALDYEKKQLERSIKILDGYDINSTSLWNSIQLQVKSVLTAINDNITDSTNKNKNNYIAESINLNNVTTNSKNNYVTDQNNFSDYVRNTQKDQAQSLNNTKAYSTNILTTQKDMSAQIKTVLNDLANSCIVYGKNINNNLANGISSTSPEVIYSVVHTINGIDDIFNKFLITCKEFGINIDKDLDVGIKDSKAEKQIIVDVKDLSNKVIKQFQDSFGIHSPSRVMYQIGLYLIQGLINGMSAKDIQSFINSQLGNIINNITESGVSAIGHGVERWRSIAATALTLTGHYSSRNLDLLMRQMNTESGGDPNSVNLWDINAKEGHPSQGLMQVIPSTFKSYAMKGYDKNILDPLSNIIAAIRYTWSRYGDAAGVWGQGHGYASGSYDTIEGLIKKNENGYEAELQPNGQGDYEWVPENSKIFNDRMTKTLWNIAKDPSGFIAGALPNDYIASTFKSEYGLGETISNSSLSNGHEDVKDISDSNTNNNTDELSQQKLSEYQKLAQQIIDVVTNMTFQVSHQWEEQENNIKTLTSTLTDNYNKQYESTQNLYNEVKSLFPQFKKLIQQEINENAQYSNSLKTIIQSLTNLGSSYMSAETQREDANNQYNSFNKSLTDSGENIAYYSSGTDYAKGGLSVINEEGQETVLKPLTNGNYTMLDKGSKVFTNDMTKNLKLWSQYNPQTMVLKAMSSNSDVGSNIADTKIIDTGTTVNQSFSGSVFEVQGASDALNMLKSIENIGLDAIQRTNKH